ncbi:class 1 isoprenoid biosynthesis enzyme [Niastella populi]|uniref:Phytoene synthase n=1 Tax=Niastella populi TaxID=550983 RepID=A0A1V9EI35_9BACT|nr:class 1 isoprenoid biosynthesis enzyme [Niastella populi]OQP45722.1 hypothetical protein A4R26_09510 [Niastella populi]
MRPNDHPTVSSFRILSRMLNLYRQIKKQERFFNNHLPIALAGLVPDFHQRFSPAHIKRITKYWQLGLNLVCKNLYNLTGKELQPHEHKRIVLLSVFGPLFDDLFDDKILGNEQIISLVTKPETYIAVNDTDRLVTKIYLELLRNLPRKQLFMQQLRAVSYWQQESLKQLNDNITEEELYRITYNKSYYAVLLYCAVLDEYPNEEMRGMLFPVAGLMQLTNDAFDVYKDVHNNVYTLPILYRNFEQLQQHFMAEVARINTTLWRLPYTEKAKLNYAITIHSLHAMGWMALEQLKQVTTGIPTVAALRSMSRKSLVCDMDNFEQKRKWLGHIRRITNYSDSAAGNRPAFITITMPV